MNCGVEIKGLRRDSKLLDMLCIPHLCAVQNELAQIATVFNNGDLV